jgi:hypothetical protein
MSSILPPIAFIDHSPEAVAKLLRLSQWRRTQRGNLTRLVGHLTKPTTRLTVFEHPKGSGRYCWSIADKHNSVRFSAGSYATEDDAIVAVMEEVRS